MCTTETGATYVPFDGVQAAFIYDFLCSGVMSPTIDPQGLAEVMPPSAVAYLTIVPPVQTIAEDTPYAVPAAFATTVR